MGGLALLEKATFEHSLAGNKKSVLWTFGGVTQAGRRPRQSCEAGENLLESRQGACVTRAEGVWWP